MFLDREKRDSRDVASVPQDRMFAFLSPAVEYGCECFVSTVLH